jgi:hypothetical protein
MYRSIDVIARALLGIEQSLKRIADSLDNEEVQPQHADDCSNMQGFECDCGAEGYDAGRTA